MSMLSFAASRAAQALGRRTFASRAPPQDVDIPLYFKTNSKSHYSVDARMLLRCSGTAGDWFRFCFSGRVWDSFALAFQMVRKTPMQLHDARALEESEGLTKREFFDKYSFVVLDHRSQMTAEGWLASSTGGPPEGMTGKEFAEWRSNSPTPVKKTYDAEVESLLRQLLPTATKYFLPARGVRRGPGDKQFAAVYAAQVHTDFPVVYEDFRATNEWMGLDDQLDQYEQCEEHRAHMLVNLRRPVAPMQEPLQDRPLAFIDPNTVDVEKDLLGMDLLGQFPGGQTYMNIKQNANHKWYYYPNMTTDEVLVWKQSHFHKNEGEAFTTRQAQQRSAAPVPHTAVDIPGTPGDCEVRCSFEIRVGCLCSTPSGQ